MEGVTQYKGLAGRYFNYMLTRLIEMGKLEKSSEKILDFGCGIGELKRRLGPRKVVGFDIISSLSDVADWRIVDFDILVANQVFYCLTSTELDALLVELKQKNPNLLLVVGISRQGLLNNIGKYLLGRPDAHSRTKISPTLEAEILLKHCELVHRTNVLMLSDIYLLQFKDGGDTGEPVVLTFVRQNI